MEGFGEQVDGAGHATWTSPMSSFMLTYLANIVATGVRTSSGFKKVHLNACARAVNEKFGTNRNGDQIKNHLKTWQKKYAKIQRLMNVSAAGWDEANYIITLDAEHYNNHIQAHKTDAEFFNKPLEHYAEMATIFGNTMTTGRFAKDSSAPLGTEDAQDVDANPNSPADATPSPPMNRPNKRARTDGNEEPVLVSAFRDGAESLAKALKKDASGDMDLPEDLIHKVTELPGFTETHKWVSTRHHLNTR